MSNLNNWCILPTKIGDFRMYDTGSESLKLLSFGDIKNINNKVLLRIHSSCIASEVFGALDCDCADQLKASMKLISKEKNGIIIYINQEGRGQGLSNKIKAIHLMQSNGLDTVEAYDCLGLKQDIRSYQEAVDLLKLIGIDNARLITNNLRKKDFLEKNGVHVEVVSLPTVVRKENSDYLETKNKKLKHTINISDVL